MVTVRFQQNNQNFSDYQITTSKEIQLIKEIIHCIQNSHQKEAVEMLYQLAVKSHELPRLWVLQLAQALKRQNWGLLTDGFEQEKFIGENGYFLIIAPYRVKREAKEVVKLTAIFGQIMIPTSELSEDKVESKIKELFGELRQPLPVILPFNRIASCGNVGGETGEAFIVPNGWDFCNNSKGPALNDISEQRQRFIESGLLCIERIFEPETAQLLSTPLIEEPTANNNRHLEYQIHDFGHATGLGLDYKIKHNLFPNYWYGCVEEWRSDGVEFELASRLLPSDLVGKIIAVNLCVRFALDAHRNGGLERDADVNCALLTLDSLFRNGVIYIKKGQLALRDCSYQGLLKAVELHRVEAISLTRQELNLKYPQGIFALYSSVLKVHPATKEIFDGLVISTCRDLWKGLR
ncbi:DUF6014 family protein [Geminocystis sp. NIES-3709]|uniref:DUF6014 family protein n=1 Tax=Geminocystis sp. NIES-3709 TaxID=1617448 RepID=UPI0005FC4E2F|nr:DUF6014 family protein [Geminocystis sp. NIES-3709]BAQ66947.1 hypothetical protein GM3709_3712 [Geminocystis sp. NIES-3709]